MAEDEELFQRSLSREFKMDFEKKEDDDVPELSKKPVAKIGEIYQLGQHRLMCGDTIKDLPKLMERKNAVMMFTDPPYNVAYEQGKFNGTYRNKGRHWEKKKFKPILNDKMEDDKFYNFILDAFSQSKEYLKGAPIYVCAPSMRDSFLILEGLIDSGYHIAVSDYLEKRYICFGKGQTISGDMK